MYKNYLIICLFIFLNNCSHPGTALLGPAITGATTKSLGQASMSFGKNLIIKQVHEASKKTKKEVKDAGRPTQKYIKGMTSKMKLKKLQRN